MYNAIPYCRVLNWKFRDNPGMQKQRLVFVKFYNQLWVMSTFVTLQKWHPGYQALHIPL